jgi:hypothetical protein
VIHARDIIRALEEESDWQNRLANLLEASSRLMELIGTSMDKEGHSSAERSLGRSLLNQIEVNGANIEALRRYQDRE